jgi:hypothetical protein
MLHINAICKDNSAINCITVQHKKCSLSSTLTGHTTLVYYILKKRITDKFSI